ncbi:MAG: zinc ribbon domain-containing protein [Ruminococcus sp.]|nr:zinc ribbon domain-containing protein [Ruminococcus sp.]
MICEKCGEELGNSFRYCRVCGTPVPSADSSDDKKALLLAGAENIAGAEKFFIDPNERLVGVLGKDYLLGYLGGKGLRRGFVAVTDRRVYQKGKAYVQRAGRMSLLRAKGSAVIDLADVTGTRIFSSSNLPRLILCVLFFVAAAGAGVIAFAGYNTRLFCYIAGVLLLLSAVCLLGYLVSRRGLITITYKSGGVSLDRKWFRKEEFYEFQRQLYLAKDILIEGYMNTPYGGDSRR